MLADEALGYFALGMADRSPAMSFKMTLNPDGTIAKTDIFRSWVQVTRLTYEDADTMLDGNGCLRGLALIAERNLRRRLANGAVVIEFPETRIAVSMPDADGNGGEVAITPIPQWKSGAVVRECMLLAGEGAASWALSNRVPFPFVSQEAPDAPPTPLVSGLAGFYQVRRTMKPRTLSAKPGLHAGLGLDIYSQATSPLRRYTDLLAHQQIRAFLTGAPLLDEDEILARAASAERGAIAASKSERESRQYWTSVFFTMSGAEETNSGAAGAGVMRRSVSPFTLSGAEEIDNTFDAVLLEATGPRGTFFIPRLGMETKCALPRGRQLEPNDTVRLKVGQVNLSALDIRWFVV
jgi:exoribonuclease-2